jgi:hypothetical protein
MTTQAKNEECNKARALAGLILMEGVDAMISLMPCGPAAEEIARMVVEYQESVSKARQLRDAE